MNRFLIVNLFLIFTFLEIIDCKQNAKPKSYCLIKSYEYKDEFLYSSRQTRTTVYGMERKVYVNTPNFKTFITLDEVRWVFKPIESTNNTYNIKVSRHDDEYLCSDDQRVDFLKKKRPIHLKKFIDFKNSVSEKCEWKLIDLGDRMFHILNVYYKEPLYVASSFLPSASGKNIYITKGSKTDSSIFYIYCSTANLNWFNKKNNVK